MYTKADFERIIASSVDNYQDLAVAYRAGDPRAFQNLSAIAQMAAMLSQQLEIGLNEPFEKSRDTTVLADAALKGLPPRATPAEFRVKWDNFNNTAYQVEAGRKLLDSSGRIHSVLNAVLIPPNGTVYVDIIQREARVIEHDVTESKPFYKIEIPKSGEDKYISGIYVEDQSHSLFNYRPDFTQIDKDERIYHVETDEYRRLFVVFGYGGVVGYQPVQGERINIVVFDTHGDVSIKEGTTFSLEYAYNIEDSRVAIEMSERITKGAFPIDINTLRELTKYPSVYNDNAVFLGEYDRLLRKSINTFDFLSVWNEQIEESVREPDVNNIKRLFISFSSDSDIETMQQRIIDICKKADDSWRYSFIPPVVSTLGITINASVARVYSPDAVEAKIREVLLANYGLGTPISRHGMSTLGNDQVATLLRVNIPALQDSGSDHSANVVVTTPVLPEHWHYATPDSIVVNVRPADYNMNQWGR